MARLEFHLANWADYMQQPAHKLGYPSRSLCFEVGGATYEVSEIMCEQMDINNAMTMDALIDSLPANQSCAIHHKWLHAVYRMRDMEMAYMMALDNLMMMADRRGLV